MNDIPVLEQYIAARMDRYTPIDRENLERIDVHYLRTQYDRVNGEDTHRFVATVIHRPDPHYNDTTSSVEMFSVTVVNNSIRTCLVIHRSQI